MKKLLLTTSLMMLFAINVFSQTANISKGCVPLTVQFEVQSGSSFYWEFGDGDSSDKQNPEHNYVQPGDYVAKLFDKPNGDEIGSINIKVYEDISIDIVPDTLGGCEPFEVKFDADITKHPDIEIVSYLWSFGDGKSSTVASPTNSYKTEGIFTVSVEITTSIGECDKTVRVEELITVEALYVFFRSDKQESCDYPVNFFFENFSDEESGYTYEWDFGNGITSNLYNPDSILYESPGTYDIILTIDNGSICKKSFERTIEIGDESLSQFNAPESACIGDTITLVAATTDASVSWELIGAYVLVEVDDSFITFVTQSYGNLAVKLTATNSLGCKSESVKNIRVEPTAEFTISPEGACAGSVDVELTANNQTYQNYIWNGSIEGGPKVTVDIQAPERDSFYINEIESYTQSLKVETINGCTDSTTLEFFSYPPESYFIPDIRIGFAPLTVTFTDHSTSNEPITFRGWDYNDGNYVDRSTELQHSYTFTERGRYFVKLDITNAAGCSDISKGVWITVLGPEDLEMKPDELATCNGSGLPAVGDSLVFCIGTILEVRSNFDDNFPVKLQFHTDNGRFDFCWEAGYGIHAMEHVGRFPIHITLEYDGLIFDTIRFGDFVIRGARSEFSYDYNCQNLTEVQFTEATNDADNADKWNWYYKNTLISEKRKFTYDFLETGMHEVFLEVENTASGCPPHSNSAIINLETIKASFEVADTICANEAVKIDASESTFAGSCNANFNWRFAGLPDRTTIRDSIKQKLLPGEQEIILVLEDENGCSDSISKIVHVFGVDAEFNSITSTCLPANLSFENLSQATAKIESYDWNFGSDEKDPTYEFQQHDATSDTLAVLLRVTDELGCVDSTLKYIDVFEIDADIIFDNGPNICVGEEIKFEGIIDSPNGIPLEYNWSVPNLGEFEEDSPTIEFTQSGDFLVNLNFQLENGNCASSKVVDISVVPIPIADMTTSVDGEFPICYPKIIEFQNTSIVEGPNTITWIFDDETEIKNNDNPTFSFDKGIHKVDMITRSFYGCADTITRQFELVSPEGSFEIDVTDLCFGDQFTVTLNQDTSDIYSYEWDMGDGTTVLNQNPVTHTYQYNSDPDGGGNRSTIDLILRAAEEGCEIIESVPVNISEVLADFNLNDDAENCNGIATIMNNSLGGDQFNWLIDGQSVSTDASPTITFSEEIDSLDVQLILSDMSSGCTSDTIITLDVNGNSYDIEFPNVFSPNGDNINDYFNVILPKDFDGIIELTELKIYNRWGNLIYNNEDKDNGWNGMSEGEHAPADVYAYFMEVLIDNCVKESRKGNVTIVRKMRN